MLSVLTLARRAAFAALLAGAALPAGASSLSGSYLAAMQADYRNDYAGAASYFDRALVLDPTNVGLLNNATVTSVALGDVAAARPLADRLQAADPNNAVAALVILADSLANSDFDAAATALAAQGDQVNPLLGGLVSGWIEVGRQDFPAAQAKFDAMTGNEALVAYGQYHKALALAYAGDFVSAEKILAGGPDGPLHLNRSGIVAHAEILAQMGRSADAIALIDDALNGGVPDAPLVDLRQRLASGEEVPFDIITKPKDGAAEAFLTLADALNNDETARVSLIHARLASHIRPDLVEAQLLVADVLENEEQFALATDALAGVSQDSPWYVTTEIRRANTQRAAGDPAAGIATLTALAATDKDAIEIDSALGDALRMAERFPEAVTAYTRAIDRVPEPKEPHWILFYTRGISNERAGDWPAAEADFREALTLEPDQPLVLNYLGYSMVEKREDLDEALGMIQRAAKGQPDDGYITDSLGWVYYRLGRYQDAVAPMLRAVELTPDDPVINDHLGDVLWMVGRKREAEFQWRRALSFGPAEDLDMDRIRKKLDVGLDAVLETEPKDSVTAPDGEGGRAELAPAKVNLALHVTGRRADGYHLLDSLVVFPRVGDLLEVEPAAGLSLTIDGPFARDLGAGADNLVLRAALLLRGEGGAGAALRLVKSLPVASGIGGGSADAAAALRLLGGLWGLDLPPRSVLAGLGADVPVCVAGKSCRMQGIGEVIEPVALPPFWLVLVNPGVPVSTPAVFAGLARRDNPPLPEPPVFPDGAALAVWLAGQRNDLAEPAVALAPEVRTVLDALAAAPGCRLARMSGSGATCFGFFTAAEPALAAAEALRHDHPAWWVAAAPVEPNAPSG